MPVPLGSLSWKSSENAEEIKTEVIIAMELIINLHIEKLPEGYYLATSDDIQGLVAQGRTVTETMEIARDVARRLVEAQKERKQSTKLKPVTKCFDMPLIFAN